MTKKRKFCLKVIKNRLGRNNIGMTENKTEIKTENETAEIKAEELTENEEKAEKSVVEAKEDKKDDISDDLSPSDALYPLKVSTENLGAVSAVFGQSEEEIEREFKAYKATKLFNKFDFDSTGASSDEEIKSNAEDCKKYGFGGIIVLPQYIGVAKKTIGNENVDVIGAVSFPYGEEIPYSTVRSAVKASQKGAKVLLIPVGASLIKRGENETVKKTFKKIIKKTKARVIATLECGTLTVEEAESAVRALSEAGIKEFKSSTGFKIKDDEFMNLKSMRLAFKNGNKVIASANASSSEEAVRLLGVADRISSRRATYIAEEIKEKLNIK